MNAHSKHFHVMIDSKGRATVRIMPGIDTGPDLLFSKEELAAEMADLLQQSVSVGYQIGKDAIRNKFSAMMGIRK